jgi:PIN domain nuclease of toxin-antitoxin system
MRYILDTRALLWFTGSDDRLPANAKKLIEDPDNKVIVSVVSLFEISIKVKLGKLGPKKPLAEIYRDTQLATIEVVLVLLSHPDEYQPPPLSIPIILTASIAY